ncbi:uncharacterized protein LOC114303793 [Camellia sinensis]|uniref:uncharacterized protein LOC114303793 n=1 Tax=Camellia sinensis TaxID=4442 RepID=UPI001035F209|nr:uncharacterized protein LOC114303793 [Camellia sinensis]
MVLIKRVLRCFEVLSSLRINYRKSVVCGVGVDDALLLSFAKLLNCQVHSLSLRFLGLPLGANPGRKSTWKPVLDKFRSKLSGWKRKLLSFAVGGGNRIKFWHDKWCGNTCLKNEFPLIFNLSTDKDGSLHQYFARKTSPNNWNFPIRRVMFTWELDEESSLLGALSSAPSLSPHKANCYFWACATASTGEFSVSSIYSFSNSTLGPHLPIYNHIWNRAVPLKVSFFCWLAWKNKIKSAEFMHRIGILDPSISISCTFCVYDSESASHVLLHYPFSWLIWSSIIHEWGLSWCIQDSVDGLLQWWMSVNFKHFDRLIWRANPLIVLWSLWKCRNKCIFEKAQPKFSNMSESIKIRAVLWLKATIKDLPFSIDDLTFNWRQIRAGFTNH